MNDIDFKHYYPPPTKLGKISLHTLEQIFCYSTYLPHCPHPCPIHPPSRTLLPQHITANYTIQPTTHPPPAFPPHLPLLHHPPPPQYIIHNLLQYPISSILDHKDHKILDTNHILKNTLHIYLNETYHPIIHITNGYPKIAFFRGIFLDIQTTPFLP
jgi:hypothetical protein